MSDRYRAGSRIQQVWAEWEANGPEKATKLGKTLDLADTTLKSWCRTWQLEKERGSPAAPKPKKAKVEKSDDGKPKLPKRIRGYKFNPTGKRRVICTYMKGRVGWLMEEGPEVSEVKWDDDFGEIAIINRFLRDAPK